MSKTLNNPNIVYEKFFDTFFKTYDRYVPKVRIKAKTNQALRLQKALENLPRRSKIFMNGLLKRVLHRMNSNTKIIKIF